MAVYVSTNVATLQSQRYLSAGTQAVSRSSERLTSGLRINAAGDDPANLQISNRLTAQIGGLKRGNQNTTDGEALMQLTEQALDESVGLLQRVRKLAIQSANGTNTEKDREALQEEVTQISRELTRIACKTTYGGAQVLAGAGKGLISEEGLLSVQVGADAYNTIEVKLDTSFAVSSMVAAVGGLGDGYKAAEGVFSLSSQANAQALLAGIDRYIQFVDDARSEMGAVMNRFESHIRNQSNIHEEESDARSRMRDADFAAETARLTSSSIVQDASSQMLLQAHARPQLIISLLR